MKNIRKIVSIVFVSLVFLNTGGYYLFFLGIKLKHNLHQNSKLALEEFSGSDAIIIKIPFSLPYSGDSESYENTEGKFTYNNDLYRVVKKRRMKDMLYIVCVRDSMGGAIQKSISEFSKTFAGNQQTDHQTTLKFTFIKDYLQNTTSLAKCLFGKHLKKDFAEVIDQYKYYYVQVISEPPKLS